MLNDVDRNKIGQEGEWKYFIQRKISWPSYNLRMEFELE